MDCLSLVAPEWQELILDALYGKPTTLRPSSVSNIWVAPDDNILKNALALPLSQWRLFLHPSQREAVEAGVDQDLVIVGGPGTGKTVALIHRAIRLAQSCASGESVVLVGHSPQTVASLQNMARQLSDPVPKALHIVDMIAIGRDGRPRDTDLYVTESRAAQGYLQHLYTMWSHCWSMKPRMSTGRQSHGCLAAGGKAYEPTSRYALTSIRTYSQIIGQPLSAMFYSVLELSISAIAIEVPARPEQRPLAC